MWITTLPPPEKGKLTYPKSQFPFKENAFTKTESCVLCGGQI